MALIVPGKFVFLHIPKTGGRWTKAVLKQRFPDARVVRKTTHGNPWARYGHPDLEDLYRYKTFRFAFVRHPVDWWRSFWRYRMRTKWQPDHEIDSQCMDDNFDTYVEKVLANMPGYVSEMFTRFVGERSSEIEFVGKQERLVEDLMVALRMSGNPVDRILLEFPPTNASPAATDHVNFTRAQRAALSAAERDGIKRFGYG